MQIHRESEQDSRHTHNLASETNESDVVKSTGPGRVGLRAAAWLEIINSIEEFHLSK